jgi:hypothetical protein
MGVSGWGNELWFTQLWRYWRYRRIETVRTAQDAVLTLKVFVVMGKADEMKWVEGGGM